MQGVVHGMSDQDQLVPLIDGIKDNLGRKPREASADAGYCSEANLAALAEREINSCLLASNSSGPLVIGQTRISSSFGSTVPSRRSGGELMDNSGLAAIP